VEFSSSQDLRELDLKKLQNEINFVIKRNLPVHISMKNRKEAEKEVNLRKVPDFVQEIRIVDIEGFDKRACKDPHVDNTSQIGNFVVEKIRRVGKDRYRFTFKIKD
jgi:Ser-tRNA(Ala) deacylase AlaX